MAMRQMNPKRSVVRVFSPDAPKSHHVFISLCFSLFIMKEKSYNIFLCFVQLRGHASRTSSDVRTTAVSQAAGSATMTTTVGTTRMKTSVVSVT